MSHIAISVVMSVYNNIEYIDDAVNSILGQTFTDFEFIIIDDCSNDGSREKLIKYSETDPRIKLILNEKNKGLTKNLNHGLELAQGKYIARMDGDDIAMPTRFEEQFNHFEKHNEVVLIGTGYHTIDNHSKRYRLTLDSYDTVVTRWMSIFTPPLMHPSSMYRQSLIKDGLRYDENAFPAEDFEFWSRIIRYGDCYVIPQPLIDYRLHDNNISATRRTEQLHRTAIIVKDNLTYYFEKELIHEAQIDHLMNYLYSDNSFSFSFSDVWQAVYTMKKLLRLFTQKYALDSEQKKQVNMLGARWIVKKVMSVSTKFPYKLLALLPLAGAVVSEAKAYRKRHKASSI